jgi:hypothetical protein
LNPIEKTIRNALERGDAFDRAYREKVYRSVHAALEKNLQANPDLSADVVRQRREMLKASIASIEREFIPAVAAHDAFAQPEAAPTVAPSAAREASPIRPAPPPHAPAASYAAPERPAPQRRDVLDELDEPAALDAVPDRMMPGATPSPAVEPRPRAPAARREPDFADFAPERDGPAQAAPEDMLPAGEYRPAAQRGRGRLYARIFLVVTLLAAAGMGVWWVIDRGLLLTAEQRDTSVPNPPLQLEDEDYQPDGPPPLSESQAANGGTLDWITVFSPSDPTRVIIPPGAAAEVIDTEAGLALRIRSASPDEPVLFEVGEGILQQIAGRRAVFNIVARTDATAATEIFVTCDFGALGDCGRNRYSVTAEDGDFLLGRDIPSGTPSGAGAIAIATDPENGGPSIDIVEIRVSTAE